MSSGLDVLSIPICLLAWGY